VHNLQWGGVYLTITLHTTTYRSEEPNSNIASSVWTTEQ